MARRSTGILFVLGGVLFGFAIPLCFYVFIEIPAAHALEIPWWGVGIVFAIMLAPIGWALASMVLEEPATTDQAGDDTRPS